MMLDVAKEYGLPKDVIGVIEAHRRAIFKERVSQFEEVSKFMVALRIQIVTYRGVVVNYQLSLPQNTILLVASSIRTTGNEPHVLCSCGCHIIPWSIEDLHCLPCARSACKHRDCDVIVRRQSLPTKECTIKTSDLYEHHHKRPSYDVLIMKPQIIGGAANYSNSYINAYLQYTRGFRYT